MCLAVPAQVIAIDTQTNSATVSLNTIRVDVSLALVEEVVIGDYVLIHVGFALQKIDPDEAAATLALFAAAELLPEA